MGIRSRIRTLATFLALVFAVSWTADTGNATEIVLKDGRVVSGKLGDLASIVEQPQLGSKESEKVKSIYFLDDDLRRTYFPRRQIQEVREESGSVSEIFRIPQRAKKQGLKVHTVGPTIRIEPFDKFGRRIVTMKTAQGPLDVIQAIVDLSPKVVRIRGVNYVWDVRMATSSLSGDDLSKILRTQVDATKVEERKRLVKFYLQAERYEDALKELEAIIADFKDQPDLKTQLKPVVREIRQLAARRLLGELKLRKDSAQHRLVYDKLKIFPSEDVSGELLQEARELIRDYEARAAQREAVVKRMRAVLAKVEDDGEQSEFAPVVDEIAAEMNINTFERMAAFRRLADDETLLPSERLSLALSGWLLGADSASVKTPIAVSAWKVRQLVVEYLNESDEEKRIEILRKLSSEEAASPSTVARMLERMKPPKPSQPQDPEKPGYFELEVEVLPDTPPVKYAVQLPPEYDPYRKYPTILALHAGGSSPAHEITWWAGPWKKGWRAGQAGRHGYIVVAPAWTEKHQSRYVYSAREHAVVLGALRDACRRFAVDTDRVYLTGYSIGGDAAWDIGMAHPDLWAGVIPISAVSDRYCAHYWKNAELLPIYLVVGELDSGKLAANSRELDRFMIRGYDVTVAEFLGRGHEHFSDEILRLFDWMGRKKRNFFPKEFECASMRPWDNFFWWLEMDDMPEMSMVDPRNWPPPRATHAATVRGTITRTNGVSVRAGAGEVTVWLSPEMLNLEERATIVVNGKRVNRKEAFVRPNIETLLEDVRTRCDRFHPFWAKVTAATGR